VRAWVAGCAVVLAVATVLAIGQVRADGARGAEASIVNANASSDAALRPTKRPEKSRPETDREKAERIIRAVWPDQLEDTAIAVAGCETGGTYNPRAVNWRDVHSDGSRGSFGWLQVGAVHRNLADAHGKTSRLLLPWTNARVALEVFRSQGWGAWWTCSRKVGAR